MRAKLDGEKRRILQNKDGGTSASAEINVKVKDVICEQNRCTDQTTAT